MWRADADDIDRAIDAVAGRMTEGEPPSNLRARVLQRVELQRTAPRRWIWIVAPAAAAAVLIVGVLVSRTHQVVAPAPIVAHEQRNQGGVSATTSNGSHPTSRPPSSSDTQSPTSVVAALPESHGIGRRTPRTSAAPGASDVEALAPEPLAVPSIRLTALDPAESIQLPRLEPIEPITVTPIGEPQGDRP